MPCPRSPALGELGCLPHGGSGSLGVTTCSLPPLTCSCSPRAVPSCLDSMAPLTRARERGGVVLSPRAVGPQETQSLAPSPPQRSVSGSHSPSHVHSTGLKAP